MTLSPANSHGSSLVLSATVTLTNAQIKALFTTPIAIATPTAGYAVGMLLGVSMVLDCSNGVYVNGGGGDGSIGYMPDPTDGGVAANESFFNLDDVAMGNPGVGVYPTLLAMQFAFGLSENGGVAPTTALGIGKATANYTGGGAGNTLKLTTYYIEVPLT